MRLVREIRFSVGPDLDGPVANPWAGWPAATGIQPYLTLQVALVGEPDFQTGYLCNIVEIDAIIRRHSLPLINRLVQRGITTGEAVVGAVARDLLSHSPDHARWEGCRLFITPYLSYRVHTGEPDMIELSQQFHFAASHRLHCDAFTAAKNQDVFGKCNNPSGHGHNYVFEVTVAGKPDPATGVILPIPHLEEVVSRQVVDRLDHKYLNADCPEFAELNPSVENIARVIWDLLDGRFAPVRLRRIRVWETPKTYAEYAGSGD